jgi:hypothetical protein
MRKGNWKSRTIVSNVIIRLQMQQILLDTSKHIRGIILLLEKIIIIEEDLLIAIVIKKIYLLSRNKVLFLNLQRKKLLVKMGER